MRQNAQFMRVRLVPVLSAHGCAQRRGRRDTDRPAPVGAGAVARPMGAGVRLRPRFGGLPSDPAGFLLAPASGRGARPTARGRRGVPAPRQRAHPGRQPRPAGDGAGLRSRRPRAVRRLRLGRRRPERRRRSGHRRAVRGLPARPVPRSPTVADPPGSGPPAGTPAPSSRVALSRGTSGRRAGQPPTGHGRGGPRAPGHPAAVHPAHLVRRTARPGEHHGMGRRAERPAGRSRPPRHPPGPRRTVDRGRTRRGGRALAGAFRQTLRRPGRPTAPRLPDLVADDHGGAPAADIGRALEIHRHPGGLHIRVRLRPRVQARARNRTRHVPAQCSPGRRGVGPRTAPAHLQSNI